MLDYLGSGVLIGLIGTNAFDLALCSNALSTIDTILGGGIGGVRQWLCDMFQSIIVGVRNTENGLRNTDHGCPIAGEVPLLYHSCHHYEYPSTFSSHTTDSQILGSGIFSKFKWRIIQQDLRLKSCILHNLDNGCLNSKCSNHDRLFTRSIQPMPAFHIRHLLVSA